MQETQCKINIDIVKNNRIRKNKKLVMFTKNHEVTPEIMNAVFEYSKSYNFTFVATTIDANNQGAFKECSKDSLSKFAIINSEVQTVCIDKKWQTFAYKNEIEEIKSRYNEVGIDFIYSPFILMYYIFKDRTQAETTMYLFNTKETITFVVVKNKIILFSDHIYLLKIIPPEDTTSNDEIVELPKDNDFDSEFSEFEDDLDDHIFNASEDMLDDDLVFDEKVEHTSAPSLEKAKTTKAYSNEADIQKSIELLGYIKNSIEDFYKNALYESEFISKVVIATDEKINIDVGKYIEDEILIDIELLNVDKAALISKITHDECRYNV
jgi:hypothetical protein